jgi:hypothetical protein
LTDVDHEMAFKKIAADEHGKSHGSAVVERHPHGFSHAAALKLQRDSVAVLHVLGISNPGVVGNDRLNPDGVVTITCQESDSFADVVARLGGRVVDFHRVAMHRRTRGACINTGFEVHPGGDFRDALGRPECLWRRTGESKESTSGDNGYDKSARDKNFHDTSPDNYTQRQLVFP